MYQKDFILREIEKISIMLQYLIGKVIPSKTIQEQQTTEELINKELQEQYGNDLNFILNVNVTDFDCVFSKNNGFTFNNIELLADLLFTLGNNEYSKNMNYLQRAFELYTYVAIKSKTFSFERANKINTLKTLL
ncbi:MAG TPA: hypothetical protein DCG75_01670 [Bacteroidales bacterium]|nr:hypothetical protein [Bacteroidales bacterium]